MTDRRRNILILLLVAGLLAASLAVIFTKSTRLGLDLKGGVSLTYQAKPTKQSTVNSDAINRTLDIMRERVDQLGVSEPEIQRSGPDQIDVSLPDVKNADEAANQVGTTAQMYFYDWETNVLDANCKPAPSDTNVTGGSSAGTGVGATDYFTAVTRASKCPERDFPNRTTNGLFYLVDTKTKKVLAGPDEHPATARTWMVGSSRRLRYQPVSLPRSGSNRSESPCRTNQTGNVTGPPVVRPMVVISISRV